MDNLIHKQSLVDNNRTTCTSLTDLVASYPDIYLTLPYMANTPLCRADFYVSITVQPLSDGTCANNLFDVRVSNSVEESTWLDDTGELHPCVQQPHLYSDNDCEHLYLCNCGDFCSVMITVSNIFDNNLDMCEVNIY